VRGVDSTYGSHVRRLYNGPVDRGGYDLGRLFTAGDAVQQVTRQPGWSVLMDLLSAERAALMEKLEGPKPLEAAETQHILGQLRGIKAAETAASTFLEIHRVELEEQRRIHEAGESAGMEVRT
jgi:hypothetical protein